MATYVLVMEACTRRAVDGTLPRRYVREGHTVHCPTLAGNGPGESAGIGLDADVSFALISYAGLKYLSDIILLAITYVAW